MNRNKSASKIGFKKKLSVKLTILTHRMKMYFIYNKKILIEILDDVSCVKVGISFFKNQPIK